MELKELAKEWLKVQNEKNDWQFSCTLFWDMTTDPFCLDVEGQFPHECDFCKLKDYLNWEEGDYGSPCLQFCHDNVPANATVQMKGLMWAVMEYLANGGK